jgi:hypothetical protein
VRPLSQLQDLFNSLPLNNSRFIYPLEILKTAPRPDAYPKGDSHWSDYGVHLVVQHIFEVLLSAGLLAEMPRYSDLHFTSAYRNADLLSKLGGSCIELQPVLHHAFRLRKTLDNGVINTGRRREFSAFAPISDKTLQLWHDSFGEWLIPYFGEVFSKTSCAWSPTVDESFVQTHSPQIMIVERAERFLIQPGTVINHTGSTL